MSSTHLHEARELIRDAQDVIHRLLPTAKSCREAISYVAQSEAQLNRAAAHLLSASASDRDVLYHDYDMAAELTRRTWESVLGQCVKRKRGVDS